MCEHEAFGRLMVQTRAYNWGAFLLVQLGLLGVVLEAHWALQAAHYTLGIASYVLAFRAGRKCDRLLEARREELAAVAARIPVFALEIIIRDKDQPDWFRAAASEELARRKGGLN